MKEFNFSKIVKYGFTTLIVVLMAGVGSVSAFECKVKQSSMAKPSGFPSRA